MLWHSMILFATPVCSKLMVWMKIGSLLRHVIWRRKVGIACYHSIDPQVFESHLRILKKNYNLISLGTLVNALHTDDWRRIPPNAMAITFDDGMKDVYELKNLLVAAGFNERVDVWSKNRKAMVYHCIVAFK